MASSVPDLGAHDPETMRMVMRRFLAAPDGRPYPVLDCRIANTRRRDGSRGTIQYEVRLEDTVTGTVRDVVVTGITLGGNRTRRIWESIRQSGRDRSESTIQSPFPSFAYVPELDLLLQVFPFDHRLPGLAWVMAGPSPELLACLIEEFGPGEWTLHKWDAQPVQYRVDMRAILRLDVEVTEPRTGRTSNQQFFAKVYRDPEQGQRAYRTQRNLYDHIPSLKTHLTVAKPIAYFDDLRTLITNTVPGTSLSKLIRRGQESTGPVQSAARAVAEFHQLNIVAPQRSIVEDITRLQEAQAFLQAARPDLAGEVSGIIEAVVAGLENAPFSLIHGDLKPDHILINGDHVALIDFDLLGSADPVIDVAHLLGFLGKPQKRSRTRHEDADDVAQIFVDEYFTHVPDSWKARLPLHHAMTSIHKAVGLCQRRGDEHQHLVEDVLREGLAFLESDADGTVPSYKRRLTRPAVG